MKIALCRLERIATGRLMISIIASGVMMMIGRRNRSQMSVDGATGLPWVIGGLSCVVLAVPVVNNLFA